MTTLSLAWTLLSWDHKQVHVIVNASAVDMCAQERVIEEYEQFVVLNKPPGVQVTPTVDNMAENCLTLAAQVRVLRATPVIHSQQARQRIAPVCGDLNPCRTNIRETGLSPPLQHLTCCGSAGHWQR